MGDQVRPPSRLSKTLVEDAPVARMRWFCSSNWRPATLARRSEKIRFQESPMSVLRNTPSRAASQMLPEDSTATELMLKSSYKDLGGSQLSPPLTDTASALRPAATPIRSAPAMLMTALRRGRSSARQG